jgi:hypothetical protein
MVIGLNDDSVKSVCWQSESGDQYILILDKGTLKDIIKVEKDEDIPEWANTPQEDEIEEERQEIIRKLQENGALAKAIQKEDDLKNGL